MAAFSALSLAAAAILSLRSDAESNVSGATNGINSVLTKQQSLVDKTEREGQTK